MDLVLIIEYGSNINYNINYRKVTKDININEVNCKCLYYIYISY